MGRKSRRLRVRVVRAAAVVGAAAFLYQRWQLRSFGLQPASAFESVVASATPSPTTEAQLASSQSSRWSHLQASSPENPFDLLVVGGGLTGLYTAVDAAQRGLRVALVEAADIGGGSTTSHMPTISPGALPYVQRAIRQRDATWLRLAMTVMEEETTWSNVAAACVQVPSTAGQRAWTRLCRWREYWAKEETEGGATSAVPSKGVTMLLPALHSSEMLEYACAALISTFLSVLCGPLRPASLLSTSTVEARLPALSPVGAPASNTPAVRVKGGVVTRNTSIDGSTAAVALAATAEKLGVALCTYAPVVRIEEMNRAACNAMERERVDDRKQRSWWRFGRPSDHDSAGAESPLMMAHVCNALALANADSKGAAPETSGSTSFLSRWFGPRANATVPGSGSGATNTTTSVSSASTAAVYARSIINCAGCGVDAVKALYDGNAQDTVPAAFAGYLAYSYLVAPSDAVHAAVSMPSSIHAATGETGNTHCVPGEAESVINPTPLSSTTHASGLHFSSPRLSFASTMVVPWYDKCVLLGPSISQLPHLLDPSNTNNNNSTASNLDRRFSVNGRIGRSDSALDGTVMVQSKDGYAAQRDRVLSMLASCGVTVDASRLLSCVSQTVPYVKSPKEVPFQKDLLDKGYALHFSSLPLAGAAGKDLEEERMEKSERRREVGFLHVYGGNPVLARRTAEDAVDALVRHVALSDSARVQQLNGCRTRRLRLDMPASLAKTRADNSAAVADQQSALTRLEGLIKETHALRLADVVARRTHVAYTSPDDALRALPSIAAVMGALRGWSKEREEAELAAARRLVTSVALSVPATTG